MCMQLAFSPSLLSWVSRLVQQMPLSAEPSFQSSDFCLKTQVLAESQVEYHLFTSSEDRLTLFVSVKTFAETPKFKLHMLPFKCCFKKEKG